MLATVSVLTSVLNASRLLTGVGDGKVSVPLQTEPSVLTPPSLNQNAFDIAYIFSPPGNLGLLSRPVANVLLLTQASGSPSPVSQQSQGSSRDVVSSSAGILAGGANNFSIQNFSPQNFSSQYFDTQSGKNNFGHAISAFTKTAGLSSRADFVHSFNTHV